MGENTSIERRYLCKEKDKQVFVENCDIYDHQIDGLRFLWKQFKKKNPGVVLNFPAQSGKSVTILLFLYAIRKLWLQPVLILCKDEKQVEEWHHCLNQWTGFTDDDIAVEPTKALLKKQIFIKSMSDLLSFTRRSWTILVYKDNEYIGLPQFGDVDFYIWATSTDVVKDSHFLSNVYHWMCPKANMKFDNGNGDMRKRILLDALLEDIVLRINKITNEDKTTIEECTPVKRSKKNKDITGTKIKRSKVTNVTIDKQNNIDLQMEEVNEVSEILASKSNELKHNVFDRSNDSCDMDLNVNANNEGQNTQENCYLHYDETASDIVSPVGSPSVLEADIKDSLNNHEDAKNADPNPDTSINVNNESDKEMVDLNDLDNLDNLKVNEATVTQLTMNSSIQELNKPDNILEDNNDSPNSESPINLNFKDKHEIFEPNSSGLNNLRVNELSTAIKDDLKSESIVMVKNINESMNLSVVKHESELDSKLNELEEKAMKKFKGSFLDSIF